RRPTGLRSLRGRSASGCLDLGDQSIDILLAQRERRRARTKRIPPGRLGQAIPYRPRRNPTNDDSPFPLMVCPGSPAAPVLSRPPVVYRVGVGDHRRQHRGQRAAKERAREVLAWDIVILIELQPDRSLEEFLELDPLQV